MAVIYKKISQLDTLTSELKSDDMMIISRPSETSTNDYESYKASYSKLSSDLANVISASVENEIGYLNKLGKVNNYENIRSGGTRLVQENVISTVKSKLDKISSDNFLDKTLETTQYITGVVEFQTGLKTKKQPTEDNDITNKSYVDTLTERQDQVKYITRYGYNNLTSYVFTSTSAYEDVEGQGIIWIKNSCPVVIFNDTDRMINIQIVSDGRIGDAGIFIYNTSYCLSSDYKTVWNELKAKLAKNDLNNLCLIDSCSSTDGDVIHTTNLHVKGGTFLCIVKNMTINRVKKTIIYQDIIKNYNKSRISEHLSTPESYTDESGWFYHYTSYITKTGKTNYSKDYDIDTNGKKYKKYGPVQKQINTVEFVTSKSQFAVSDTVIVNSFD